MPRRHLEIVTETKCRRCGNLNEWQWVAPKWYSLVIIDDFTEQLAAMKVTPVTEYCENCNKSTVQELVAYEFKFDGGE